LKFSCSDRKKVVKKGNNLLLASFIILAAAVTGCDSRTPEQKAAESAALRARIAEFTKLSIARSEASFLDRARQIAQGKEHPPIQWGGESVKIINANRIVRVSGTLVTDVRQIQEAPNALISRCGNNHYTTVIMGHSFLADMVVGVGPIDGAVPREYSIICSNTEFGRKLILYRQWLCGNDNHKCIESEWSNGRPIWRTVLPYGLLNGIYYYPYY
jgi:hypothetical protein